jgi:predicted ribonuclease toxin of YeeF-YezG toxin-antitoxin module
MLVLKTVVRFSIGVPEEVLVFNFDSMIQNLVEAFHLEQLRYFFQNHEALEFEKSKIREDITNSKVLRFWGNHLNPRRTI